MKDLTLQEWQLIGEAIGNKVGYVDMALIEVKRSGPTEAYNRLRWRRRALAALMRKVDRRIRRCGELPKSTENNALPVTRKRL